MDSLTDLLLRKPISDAWLTGLLFSAFVLHLMFVLFTLGTGILSVYYLLLSWRRGGLEERRWHREIIHTFMAHKSIAVVLGIGPLLLMQVGFTVPFFTAVTMLAPYWLGVILLLVTAFLLLDLLGDYRGERRVVGLALGVIGLTCLLAIPGVFVAVLSVTENPDKWLPMTMRGYRMPPELSIHWLFRYLHILGAAVVFGAAFHYFASKADDSEKKQSLLRWIVGGLLFQVLLGVMLYTSVPRGLSLGSNLALFVGILAAMSLLWHIYDRRTVEVRVGPGLLGVLLISMLLARQFHQYSAIVPLQRKIEKAERAYQSRLKPFGPDALAKYKSDLRTVYDNGDTIYAGSCTFCHGDKGDGKGSEAHNLSIPPENLTAVRTNRRYLQGILLHGIDGSAMPYFSIFTTDKLDSLMRTLDKRFGVLRAPEPFTRPVSKEARTKAAEIYSTTCAVCHGKSGRITLMGKGLAPQPPDLTQYTPTFERSFDVITNGYPGTSMPAYRDLPPDVRWGLVGIVRGLFQD